MSNIQWTHWTWNPTTGCDEVSSECDNCWARKDAQTKQKMAVAGYERGFDITPQPQRLDQPEGYPGSKYIFTCSMSDLLHRRISDAYIYDVFDVMQDVDRHCYQILTKRPERYAEMDPHLPWDEHIWAGTSVGVPDTKGRLDDLRECNAGVTFVSFEPLVEPLGDLNLDGIDWAIIGGEAGDADEIRPMDLNWARDIIAHCREQNTAVFVKQLGELWARDPENGTDHRHGGNILDWPVDLQIREMPEIYPDQPELDTLALPEIES